MVIRRIDELLFGNSGKIYDVSILDSLHDFKSTESNLRFTRIKVRINELYILCNEAKKSTIRPEDL